ncbi:MAG: hypothetical protein K0S68_1116 [Candidatus Saccharibacteria bacterium]|jgi:hypothetical protein|nr:hypothetical protein [Candidatus Saccharibacteria bacterium]
MDAWLDRIGRSILAFRARRVLGRAFGPEVVDVFPQRARPMGYNHVQVFLTGYNNTLLLYPIEPGNYPMRAALRELDLSVYCPRCPQVISSGYVRRWAVKRDVGRLIKAASPHQH